MRSLKLLLYFGLIFIFSLSFLSAQEKNKSQRNKNQKTAPIMNYRETPGIVNVHSIGIGLGETFLMGEFEDYGDDRISLDLFYAYSASYSFDVVANVHYSEHKLRRNKVKLPGLTFAIKGKIFQFDSFAPYVIGGLGFYRPKVTRLVDGAYFESEGKATFGYNLGAGADLRLNRNVLVGILGQIHNPFDVKQDIGPKVEGSYAKLMLTAMYTF